MRYLPHTTEEIQTMLQTIGVPSLDALFEGVPAAYKLNRPLALPKALDEASLMRHLESLADSNHGAKLLSFMGAGIYEHHIPSMIDQLLLRSEFYTAYTPYQAELSQGTLQTLFEFQTVVSELLGLEVANASMYDGASAMAEAALMARRITGKEVICASAGLHPEYLETLGTYLHELDGGKARITSVELNSEGVTDMNRLRATLNEDVAAVIVGYPNFFGGVESLEPIVQVAHEKKALVIAVTSEPYALSLIQAPGAAGVDIAVAEGQALATAPQLGGPGVGLFACRKEFVQKMPGRLVGRTVDNRGKTGYVLTLSTREQHIRRERATSNICTNHNLVAIALTIHCALLGVTGFRRMGQIILSQAEYLKKALTKIGYTPTLSAPTFNEWLVQVPHGKTAASVASFARKLNVVPGVPLSQWPSLGSRPNELLIAVTERHRRDDLDRLVDVLSQAAKNA